jgi:hypothetical protein
MTVGTQVNVIAVQLNALLSQIRQETLNRLPKGTAVNPADARNADYFNKLDGWKHRLEELRDQLSRLERQVEGQRAFAPAVGRGASFETRRTAAYRANQSLESASADIQQATALAAEVSSALIDLLRGSITPTRLDVEKSVTDLLENPLKFHDQVEALARTVRDAENAGSLDHNVAGQLRTGVAQLTAPPVMGAPGMQPPDFFAVAPILLTLVRVWWLERIRQQERAGGAARG